MAGLNAYRVSGEGHAVVPAARCVAAEVAQIWGASRGFSPWHLDDSISKYRTNQHVELPSREAAGTVVFTLVPHRLQYGVEDVSVRYMQ